MFYHLRYTAMLKAMHHSFKRPVPIKVEYSVSKDKRSILLVAKNAINNSQMPFVDTKIISNDKFATAPFDDIENARWAFALLGLGVLVNQGGTNDNR